ncbi:hypothetical protein JKG47_12895 [Acidithiobacillus sp. MC6.1]|nr:hypothetical protein [Acidithiobacillus sp. MC6.1]
MRRRKVKRREPVRGVYYEVAPHPDPALGFVTLATVDGVDIRPQPVSTLVFFPIENMVGWDNGGAGTVGQSP